MSATMDQAHDRAARSNGGSSDGNRTYERAAGGPSTGHLLSRLAHDVPELLIKELALARAELTQATHEMKAGIGSVAIGGAVTLAGLVVLLMSAVYGLALVMSAWLAALLVGGVVTAIGLIMLGSGSKRMSPSQLRPGAALDATRHDRELLREHARHGKDDGTKGNAT